MVTAALPMKRTATFSNDRRYRYSLHRSWTGNLWPPDRARQVLFVMLNPSTADGARDDATIRRCVGYARRWGFHRLAVGNLFGWISTDPRGLLAEHDPVGLENDWNLRNLAVASERIVLAWGSHAPVRHLIAKRQPALIELLWSLDGKEIGSLGTCADGTPRHPLRLPVDVAFTRWNR